MSGKAWVRAVVLSLEIVLLVILYHRSNQVISTGSFAEHPVRRPVVLGAVGATESVVAGLSIALIPTRALFLSPHRQTCLALLMLWFFVACWAIVRWAPP